MIIKYELIAPVTDRKAPYLNRSGAFIVPAIKKLYKYYVEVKRYNPDALCYEYFLLLSDKKFDVQCRKCRVDDYGRLKVKLHGEFLDFVANECTSNGNVQFNYEESEDCYDIWKIG